MNGRLWATLVMLTLISLCQAQCSNGYNCNCAQCNLAGYSEFCGADNECYRSELTCTSYWDGCSDSSTCQSTDPCSLPLQCTASQISDCGSGTTCCLDQSGTPFCFNEPNAVCCNYNNLACSAGYVCDPDSSSGCVAPVPSQSTTCSICQKAVSYVESNGCSYFCGVLPPPADAVCAFAMDNTDLCSTILSWIEGGLTPLVICEMIPFFPLCASAVTCECGYCQPSVYGSWCLALDATCPGASILNSSSSIARNKNATVRQVKNKTGKEIVKGKNICLDGTCSESNAGCCLTCAL